MDEFANERLEEIWDRQTDTYRSVRPPAPSPFSCVWPHSVYECKLESADNDVTLEDGSLTV